MPQNAIDIITIVISAFLKVKVVKYLHQSKNCRGTENKEKKRFSKPVSFTVGESSFLGKDLELFLSRKKNKKKT